MANRESDIAALAKKQGADAVILVSEGAETVGFVGANNNSTSGNINSMGNTGTSLRKRGACRPVPQFIRTAAARNAHNATGKPLCLDWLCDGEQN